MLGKTFGQRQTLYFVRSKNEIELEEKAGQTCYSMVADAL